MAKHHWTRTLCIISLISSALAHICIGCDWTPPPKPDQDRVVIGIDLGYSSAVMSVDRDNVDNLVIIPNELGERTIPYRTSFCDPLAVYNASHEVNTMTWTNIAHEMGECPGQCMHQSISCSSDVDEDHWDAIIFRRTGKECDSAYTEMFAMVLGDLKQRAEVYLGKNVSEAIITVPSHVPYACEQLLRDAGTLANLNILRVFHKSYAAAYAYKTILSREAPYILVFEFGDNIIVSAVEVYRMLVMAATSQDHLNERVLDQPVINHFIQLYKNKTGIDVSHDNRALTQLRFAAKCARHILSVQDSTVIRIEALSGNTSFVEALSRDTFEHLNIVTFNSTILSIEQLLQNATVSMDYSDDITLEDVSEIILTGNSTYIPIFHQLLTQFFGKEPVKDFAPAEVSAHGAAMYGSSLAMAKSEAFEYYCPCYLERPLGIGVYGGVMMPLIRFYTQVPFWRAFNFTTVYDNQSSILVQAYEGVRDLAKENHFIGEFELSGIPPAPRGIPEIEIAIEIDEDFITRVSASHGGRTELISTPMSSYSHPDWVRSYEAARESAADGEQVIKARRIKLLDLLLSDIHRLRLQISNFRHLDYASQDLRRRSISLSPGPTEMLHLDSPEALNIFEIQDLVRVIQDVEEWLKGNSLNATGEDIEAERDRLQQRISRLIGQKKSGTLQP